MTEQCAIITCKKRFKSNDHFCSHCKEKYCSNKCLEIHSLLCKLQSRETSKKKTLHFDMKGTFYKSSPFIKKGEFLLETNNDKDYEFEFIDVLMDKIIGKGLYGDIYLAKHSLNNKFLAIKQMNKSIIKELNVDENVVFNEMNFHNRLIHENIIRAYSAQEDEEAYYLIMDYAVNGSLKSFIDNSNGIEEKQAFKYFIQTASAVHFLHLNNLIHRDLKPENLLLDENGNIKLCDFGWCADLKEGCRMTFCGTYEYMAPEVLKESPYDTGIDVWALGILLYELIEGKSPFKGENEEDYNEIYRNVMTNELIFTKEISKECKDLIKKLLKKEKNSRLQVSDIFCHPWVINFEKEFIVGDISTSTSETSNFSLKRFKNHIKNEERKIKFDIRDENKRKLSVDSKELSFNQDQESLFDKVLLKVHSKKNGKQKSNHKISLSRGKGEVTFDKMQNLNKSNQLSEEKRNTKYSLVEEAVEDISNFHLKEKKESEKRLTDLFLEEVSINKESDYQVLPLKDSQNELYQTIINKYDKNTQEDIYQFQHYGLNNIGPMGEESHNPRITESLRKNISPVRKENLNNTSFVHPLKKKSLLKDNNKKYLFNAIDILEKTQENKNVVSHIPEKKGIWGFLNNFRCGKCD